MAVCTFFGHKNVADDIYTDLFSAILELIRDYDVDVFYVGNQGEFDMIMLVNVDPVYSYEACMIGRNAYWINGLPIEADCPMTAVMNVSVSRRDANFECFGHMMEMIMGHVFCDSTEESGYCDGEFNGIPV